MADKTIAEDEHESSGKQPPKVPMGPDLFARLQEIEAGLPPEDMSLAAVVQMCMTYYANHGQGVDIPKYSEKATRKARKWVRMQEHPPVLPDGLRVVDIVAWRLAMYEGKPEVHPRRTMGMVATDGE
jgi:hypothetical protein